MLAYRTWWRPVQSALLAAALALQALFVAPIAASEGDKPSGLFLVASRKLQDPNFRETVVLVTRHRHGAPVGVIVNRPMETRLNHVFADQPGLRESPEPVYFGGPVSRQMIVFVFSSPGPPPQNALPVLDDVYMSFSRELIEKLLGRENPTRGLRVYAGYAGWAPGQLEKEIARGDWHLVPAEPGDLFDGDPSGLWPKLIMKATERRADRAPVHGAGG